MYRHASIWRARTTYVVDGKVHREIRQVRMIALDDGEGICRVPASAAEVSSIPRSRVPPLPPTQFSVVALEEPGIRVQEMKTWDGGEVHL